MIKIYCDTSGYQSWLQNLLSNEVVIVSFPYENKNRRIKEQVSPSNPTWDQMKLTWDVCNFTWNNFSASEKFNSIKQILKQSGQNIDVDAQHLDCAYKNNCQIFLTNDKTDILNNKFFLEKLLDLRIFNANQDQLLVKQLLIKLQKKS